MIIGAHFIIYSRNPAEDRAFLRQVLRLPSVDVGGGWLIFGLPPAEVAVHPHDRNSVHEIYLMCDDIGAFVARMAQRNIRCEEVKFLGWGSMTHVTLPGGGKLGVYQPRHKRPRQVMLKGKIAKKAQKTSPKKAPTRRKPKKKRKLRKRVVRKKARRVRRRRRTPR